MGDLVPLNTENGAHEGLTPIHGRIHCAATPDTDAAQYTETERVIIDNFLNTLAEVALSVASRKVGQSEEPCSPDRKEQ